ncbi:MAG: TIGR00730 family Rossman fold protein [Sandaracinaceae bacterium]|nr:TIGR00730 family Rossman fold protein [Sandaracinaceae bacterium]
MKRLCVFCGSAPGASERYAEAAAEVGRALARRGVGLVYGGASIGTMGIVADAALTAGGEVIGVVPVALVEREVAHRGLTELIVVDGMHARKARMTELSDAFLALPGGYGTLDELFEALTWSQLGIHAHPVGLWDVGGYWSPLLTLLDAMVREGFLHPANRARLTSGDALEPLLDALLAG